MLLPSRPGIYKDIASSKGMKSHTAVVFYIIVAKTVYSLNRILFDIFYVEPKDIIFDVSKISTQTSFLLFQNSFTTGQILPLTKFLDVTFQFIALNGSPGE